MGNIYDICFGGDDKIFHQMEGYKICTFNEERFPDPKSLILRLRRRGIRTVTIVDPGVKKVILKPCAPSVEGVCMEIKKHWGPHLVFQEDGYGVYEQGKALNAFVRSMRDEVYEGEVLCAIFITTLL